MSVNSFLNTCQVAPHMNKVGLWVPEIENVKANWKVDVHELSKSANDIRAFVIDVGGLPL